MTTTRFETLLVDTAIIDQRRRRMMASLLMAATLSMAAGTAMWLGDKLGISAVPPPTNAYAVTLSLQLAPPPPRALPERPKGEAAADPKRTESQAQVQPEPEVPEEVAPLDLDDPPVRRTSTPGPSTTTTTTGGGPSKGLGLGGGGGIGGPGCLLPPCTKIGQPPRIPPVSTPRIPVVATPLRAAMARALYSPNPDSKKLARTKTGLTHRSPGRSTVSFCIDPGGRTSDVETRRPFRGDAQVDRICRETVQKWRFKALRVGGKARKSCTQVTFDIEFD